MAMIQTGDASRDRRRVRESAYAVRFTVVIVAAILGGQATTSCAVGAPPDRQTLRDILDRHWRGIDTLEFLCEVFNIDEFGTRDIAGGYSRIHYAIASGGRRCSELWGIWPDHTTRFRTIHEDGHRKYAIQAFADDPDSVDTVFIRTPKDTHDENTESMNPAMFCLTPLGRPLSYYITESAEITGSIADDGDELIVVKATGRKGPMTIELDPRHDWLARRVILDRGVESRITKFRLDNGRWFPEEGRIGIGTGKTVERQLFTVANLSINRPIAPSLFSVATASLAPGVIVTDDRKKDSEIVGGFGARELLVRKHTARPVPDPKGLKVVEKPLLPARTQPTRLVTGLLMGLGLGSFVVAAIIAARRRLVVGH